MRSHRCDRTLSIGVGGGADANAPLKVLIEREGCPLVEGKRQDDDEAAEDSCCVLQFSASIRALLFPDSNVAEATAGDVGDDMEFRANCTRENGPLV